MDYSQFTDREGLQQQLELTEPPTEPTNRKVMHVTKLEGALEGMLSGIGQSFARAFCRAGRGLGKTREVPRVHYGIYGGAADGDALNAAQEKMDEERRELLEALSTLGLAQSAGSAGAGGAVVNAPSPTATPMFNPGKVHRLLPGQIPSTSAGTGAGLPGAIATIIAAIALEALLSRVGRTVEEEDERRRCDKCLRNGYRVLSAFRLYLSQAAREEAIRTDDNEKRHRRNRKSNKN